MVPVPGVLRSPAPRPSAPTRHATPARGGRERAGRPLPPRARRGGDAWPGSSRASPATVCGRRVECLVVDDGSTDATAALAAAAGADVLRQGRNRGLGAAVRAGLAEAVERGAGSRRVLRRGRRVRAGGAGAARGADPRRRGRLRGRLPVRRRHPARCGPTGCSATSSSPGCCRFASRGADQRRPERLPRLLPARRPPTRRSIHDFNYAQVLTLDLLAKGYRYAEVPISYAFRDRGPVVRAPRPLPPRTCSRRCTAS